MCVLHGEQASHEQTSRVDNSPMNKQEQNASSRGTAYAKHNASLTPLAAASHRHASGSKAISLRFGWRPGEGQAKGGMAQVKTRCPGELKVAMPCWCRLPG